MSKKFTEKNYIYIGILVILLASIAFVDEPFSVKKTPLTTPEPTPVSPPIQTTVIKQQAEPLPEITPVETESEPDALEEAREKVKQRFISDEEPTTKYAQWKSERTFQVLVFDDGSKRDGYAEYVCLTLYEYGFTGENITAQVIDWYALMQEKYEKVLGSHNCIET